MSKNVNNLSSYGQNQPLIGVFDPPIASKRNPTGNDKASIGRVWVNKLTNTIYILSSFAGGQAVWTAVDNSGATGITWSREAGAAVAMTNNHGYVNTNAGLTTFTLPAVSPLGSVIKIIGEGAGGWRINAQAGQNFRFGQVPGVAGGSIRIPINHTYASISLITSVANTTFEVVLTNDNINVT